MILRWSATVGYDVRCTVDCVSWQTDARTRARVRMCGKLTLKDLTDHKSSQRLREEWNEDKGSHEDGRDEHGLLVTKLLGGGTDDLETDDLTDQGTVGKTSLPWSANLALASGVAGTVLASEVGLSEEVTQQHGVVSFHDQGQREEDGPHDGGWVILDRLPSGSVLFLGSDLSGIVNEGIVVFDLRCDLGLSLGVDLLDLGGVLEVSHCCCVTVW